MNIHVAEQTPDGAAEWSRWQADYIYREPRPDDYGASLTDLADRWAVISSVTTGSGWPDASMSRLCDILQHLWRHIVDAPIRCADDRDGKLLLIRAWIADEDACGECCNLPDDVILLERQVREYEAA